MTTGIANLTGSEKQIEWGSKCREELIPVIGRATVRTIRTLEERGRQDLTASVQAAHESIVLRTEAGWWIDHRCKASGTSYGLSDTAQILLANALSTDLSDDDRDAIADVISGY